MHSGEIVLIDDGTNAMLSLEAKPSSIETNNLDYLTHQKGHVYHRIDSIKQRRIETEWQCEQSYEDASGPSSKSNTYQVSFKIDGKELKNSSVGYCGC